MAHQQPIRDVQRSTILALIYTVRRRQKCVLAAVLIKLTLTVTESAN